MSMALSLFSIFIHQNTRRTAGFNIFSILKERFKALLKVFLIDFDSLTLQRRPQKVIFEHIFLKIRFYIVGFSILTISRHIDMQVNM